MKQTLQLFVANEAGLDALARAIAARLTGQEYLALRGDLGAGKTTFARALLRALGYLGNVRSPTFTLMETYSLAALSIAHLDLYRLIDADELEFIGVRDLIGRSVLLVEWPERGSAWLPAADLDVAISVLDALDEADGDTGRTLHLTAYSTRGQRLLDAVQSCCAQ